MRSCISSGEGDCACAEEAKNKVKNDKMNKTVQPFSVEIVSVEDSGMWKICRAKESGIGCFKLIRRVELNELHLNDELNFEPEARSSRYASKTSSGCLAGKNL